MYHVEEWERRARESQAWADQRRVDVPKDRSDARWFWALFGIVALLARDLAGVKAPAEVAAAVPAIHAAKQQGR